MATAVHDEPQSHMGLPLPNGKLAIWFFLVTEIMFFTALIGTYIILRNGQPKANEWPAPHAVHLIEWVGAVNTFVLICSSLSVVLAHHALAKGNVSRAVQLIAVTFALGCVFLLIKYTEYKAKYDDQLFPGRLIPSRPFGPAVAQPGDTDKHKLHLIEGANVHNVELFYWIYFAMTGMHALHMIIGLGFMTVLLMAAWRGKCGPEYHAPVEISGLYWHFVDIIWIFLFPLLYLLGRHLEHH